MPVAPESLRRVIATPPQVGLAREQRLRNVANAFHAISGAFVGSSVLLIDDVATTGATLAACASAVVEQGGAREVWGAVVAREV
jgi:predicted amidophosphoribosyltransferase